MQFDKSEEANGTDKWRINSTSAHQINIEDASGAGLSGWGWQDDGYLADPGSIVYFETTGLQKIRIQRRENGLAIDQIVISPAMVLGADPTVTLPSFVAIAKASTVKTRRRTSARFVPTT